MIERGGERFVSKPSALPDASALRAQAPNFSEVIDEVLREVALVVDTDDPLELTPLLLVGDPGVGKTRFARGLASLLGTDNVTLSLAQTTAGWIVGGSASTWQGAKPGKVFETLLHGESSNPVVTIDEIDKASRGQYDPLGAFYALLERDTASEFVDEYVDLPVDASRIVWIATANDARAVPDPILSRMRVIEVRAPSRATRPASSPRRCTGNSARRTAGAIASPRNPATLCSTHSKASHRANSATCCDRPSVRPSSPVAASSRSTTSACAAAADRASVSEAPIQPVAVPGAGLQFGSPPHRDGAQLRADLVAEQRQRTAVGLDDRLRVGLIHRLDDPDRARSTGCRRRAEAARSSGPRAASRRRAGHPGAARRSPGARRPAKGRILNGAGPRRRSPSATPVGP